MEIKFRTELGELLTHLGLSGDAVEIGVAEGRNAQVLISQPAITKLYMIDAWQQLPQTGDGGFDQKWHDSNHREALQRTEKFKEKRVVLKGLSSDMIKQIPDESLVLAYIDGWHSYEGCYADLESILPKVKTGGVVSCHDYLNLSYGVNKAVNTFLKLAGYSPSDIHTTVENGDRSMVSCWFIKK